MTTKTINFNVNEQLLTVVDGVYEYASNTVNYVQAVFDLGTGWEDLDEIRAIWTNRGITKAMILEDGVCKVPAEVLAQTGFAMVNLAGSVYEEGELVGRITTFPIQAILVSKPAKIDGDTPELTPTEYEQFVARVEEAASKVDGAEEAAERAEAAAEYAEEAAGAAIKVKNMTVSSETGAAGTEADVEKTETEEAFNLHFTIPAGAQGPRGETGPRGERGETGPQGIQGIQGETGPQGPAGATGERGSRFLSITHAPTAYREPIGDFTPTFRMEIATILADSLEDKVLVGDRLIRINYTQLPMYSVGAVDDTYAYLTSPGYVQGPQGEMGPAGSQGSQGEMGPAGPAGPQGPQGDDYILTAQDKQDIADIVISELPAWTGGNY